MRLAFYLKLFAVLGLLLLKFCAANSKPSDSDRVHFLWNEPLSYYFYSEQNLAQQIMGAYDSLFLNRADKTILSALKDADKETLKKSYFLLGLYYQLNHNYQESFSSFQQALNYTHEVSEIAILHVKSAVSKQNEDHFLEALKPATGRAPLLGAELKSPQ